MKAAPAVLADLASFAPVKAPGLGAGQSLGSMRHSEMRLGGMNGHRRNASIRSCKRAHRCIRAGSQHKRSLPYVAAPVETCFPFRLMHNMLECCEQLEQHSETSSLLPGVKQGT